MTVVDCSFVPCSRPAVLGSGKAPASPGMPGADDEIPQTYHDECVPAGQDARGRTALL